MARRTLAKYRLIGAIRNLRIAPRDGIKTPDQLVLLKVATHPPQRWTYAALGAALSVSALEANASVKRAVASGLAAAPGESPVRALPTGTSKGSTFSPLCRTAPQADAYHLPYLRRIAEALGELREQVVRGPKQKAPP